MTETTTHAAVMVAPEGDRSLMSVFSDTLAAQFGRQIQLRDLCPGGEDFAHEAKIAVSGAGAARALQGRIEAALAGRADVAVVALAGRRKRLLVCDMDSTIIGQECLDELADFAGLKAEIAAITERAMRGELDFEAALTTRVAMLEGLGLEALERCYAERISLSPGARELVATMAAHGAQTLLVSGGFTFFTARVAAAAGFGGHRANKLLDDGRALTGKVAEPILGREAKLSALDESASARSLSRADAMAIGDGANDLAMIEAAGLGLAWRAKPVVAARADARIDVSDLRAALYFQGYSRAEFAG